jgi:tetratricopeptide (TPR) repeat protein
MKKNILSLISACFVIFLPVNAQVKSEYPKIDNLLINGDYRKAADTCELLLAIDSLNPEIWYKMGLAYQNLLAEDKSFDCISKAVAISPDNNKYSFTLAKSLYNKGKPYLARPALEKLCASDSTNWGYAYYLTSIYMQEGKYDESIKIYSRFLKQDTSNYVFLDKIGFANLKKGEYDYAIDLYNRSLAINRKNLNSIKNLAFLYSATNRADTAIQLLTGAVLMDPEDLDLYIRRASIFYLTNQYKNAINDYHRILNSGDSSFLYLKRAGIGYSNILKPKEAIRFLKLAYNKDSSDYETASYLGKNYYNLNDHRNSIYYYKQVIRILSPINRQLDISTIMLAESQKAGGLYQEALKTYINALKLSSDVNLLMIIANLYDEKLKDLPNAIAYYQLFLNKIRTEKVPFKSDYIESIRKRVQFLKEKLNPPVKKPV